MARLEESMKRKSISIKIQGGEKKMIEECKKNDKNKQIYSYRNRLLPRFIV